MDEKKLGKEEGVRLLSSTPLFARLKKEAQENLASSLSSLSLSEGETLFYQKEEADCLYIVAKGSFELHSEWNHRNIRMFKIRAPDALGVFPLIGECHRTAKAIALENSELWRLSAKDLHRVITDYPEILEILEKRIQDSLQRHQLVLALKLSPLFRGMEGEAIEDIEKEMDLVSVPGNTLLCSQGSSSGDIFLIVSGRFQIIRQDQRDNKRFSQILGEVGFGETVGEIGVITDEPRAADVRAIRDSTVATLSRSRFEKLLKKYPIDINQTFVRSIIGHLTGKREQMEGTSKTFALVSLTPGLSPLEVGESLAKGLRHFGSPFCVDSATCDRALGYEGGAQARFDEAANTSLLQWLGEQEMAHSYLLYITDPTPTLWTRRCLRQADHILFVAEASSSPLVADVEKELLKEPTVNNAKKTLILVQKEETVIPHGTMAWLEPRSVGMHFHVHRDKEEDFARVARFLVRKAVGLVFGGGGARGLAHAGVYRAFNELNIPIDLVGGNSMGAIMAAQCALQWGWEEMVERTIEFTRGGEELTLPIVSLFSGRRMARGFNEMFGDTQIEDMWRPFYTVSCNLSRATVMVHDKGRLSDAVLNSNTPPGLIPPQVRNGDLLVDGALLNNVPVDVMKKINGEGSIIAVDVSPREDLLDNTDCAGGITGWKILGNRLNPFAEKIRIPNMKDVLSRSSMIGGLAQRKKSMAGLADLYMVPPVSQYAVMAYRQGKRIADIGYEHALKTLRDWPGRRDLV